MSIELIYDIGNSILNELHTKIHEIEEQDPRAGVLSGLHYASGIVTEVIQSEIKKYSEDNKQ